jgi:hypothetical protein
MIRCHKAHQLPQFRVGFLPPFRYAVFCPPVIGAATDPKKSSHLGRGVLRPLASNGGKVKASLPIKRNNLIVREPGKLLFEKAYS